MKKYVNMCVDCPPEIGCLGRTCPKRNVLVYSCDVCRFGEAKYTLSDEDYCEDCIKDVLDDAFSQLSPEEKAEALGYEIKRINGEW